MHLNGTETGMHPAVMADVVVRDIHAPEGEQLARQQMHAAKVPRANEAIVMALSGGQTGTFIVRQRSTSFVDGSITLTVERVPLGAGDAVAAEPVPEREPLVDTGAHAVT